MYPPPRTRTAPGGRPTLGGQGRFDRLRVAAPWAWTGLCSAITALDGSSRDWVSGAAPSAYGTTMAVPGGDPRGGEILTRSGASPQFEDYAHTGFHASPSTAITVFVRFRFNGVGAGSGGVAAKVYDPAASPWDTWFFQVSAANTTIPYGSVTVGGAPATTNGTTAVGTALYTNMWMRWASGSVMSVDYLRDDGTAAIAQQVTGVVTGAISYPATPQPLRVGGIDSASRASIGGDFSVLLMWNRSLSDPEMYAVTFDPFGFLRRA